jgi:hypothetical protein
MGREVHVLLYTRESPQACFDQVHLATFSVEDLNMLGPFADLLACVPLALGTNQSHESCFIDEKFCGLGFFLEANGTEYTTQLVHRWGQLPYSSNRRVTGWTSIGGFGMKAPVPYTQPVNFWSCAADHMYRPLLDLQRFNLKDDATRPTSAW